MSYSIKEKEPTLVFSDQDMSYSIKEKEPTLGGMTYLDLRTPVLALSPSCCMTYPDLSKPVLALSP
jgi:hypothetical protein